MLFFLIVGSYYLVVFPFDRKLQFVLAGHKKDIAKLFDPGPSIMHSFHFLLLSFVFFFFSKQ